MVRVLMCHNFKEQKVFSDAYKPSAKTYSITRDLVFICTSKGHVFVYSLLEDGFPLLFQFPLLSTATDMIFNDIGDFIFTKEITRKDKPDHFSARVYFNWSKWKKEFANSKMKVVHLGFSFTQSFCLEPNAFTAVEVQSRFSVRSISSCPVSTNIAVATETVVSVYRCCFECPFDFQRLYIVEPGFSIYKIVLCEEFVALTSTNEVRVLQITMNGDRSSLLEQNLISESGEPQQLLSQGISSPSSCQREVFDENYVMWSFDRCQETSVDQSAFWKSILESKEWSEEELKASVIDLPALKEEVPFIDHSQEACEVLGPIKMVHGHPIKVQSALANVQNVTKLYRYFDVMQNTSDSIVELHSLQLLPFYTAVCDENKKPVPQLSGMICFVSNPKQGFIYNVFQKTEFLAHCTYTTETTMAAICNNLLYSVTSQALETYVVPIYAAVAKQVRKMQASESEDKLSIDNAVIPSDGNATDTQDVLSNSNDQESSQENKFTHYGFPVYDQEILQKPCPSPPVDLCMIGVHQFSGLISMLAVASRVLLLSHATTKSSPKEHSTKNKGSASIKDWTLHVLKAMDMGDLYHKMEGVIQTSESLTADPRLLKEQHFILRAQFQVGNLSKTDRQSLKLVLRDSAKSIGHYYARYAADDVDSVNLFYTMADLSIEEILDHHIQTPVDIEKLKERTFGNGLLCYLNNIFFKKNQDKISITLPQTTADKVLYIYSNADPSRLSTLILRPLIEGFSSELAVKLLKKLKKTKTYSFSTEDHLALVVVDLKTCSLDEAIDELFTITKEKLAEICVKHHYVLYSKDETLSPLGQLLRRRLPDVFIKTLVFLHLRNLISLTNTINLLLGKDGVSHNNSHLVEFLELLLNESRATKSFKEARECLIDIYLKKLSHSSSRREREILRVPHYHIPRGSGHFSRRFLWLDKLPPFNGYVAEPKDCPIMQANIAATSSSKRGRKYRGFLRDHSTETVTVATGTKSSCTCCCCWATLLKLQSLLCSRHCDRDLGNFVLSNLVGKTWEISITLLCLPLIDEYQKAVETLLLIDSSSVMSYAKHYFGDSYTKWQCILDVLTEKIRSEAGGDCKNYIEILQETLVILSKNTTPTVFLSLLPEDGNFAFFLPYLVKCCENNLGEKLSSQIHGR